MTNPTTPIYLAADILQISGVVAYPTETCFGLGVRADKPQAVKYLLELKNSESNKPVSILIYDQSWLLRLAVKTNQAQQKLMDAFWPGPLTLLFEPQSSSKYLHLASPLIAVRCSNHPIAKELVKVADLPITSTSANLSGQAICKNEDEIKKVFEDENIFILSDLESSSKISESTVLDVSGSDSSDIKDIYIKILREGDISLHQIKQVLKGS